MVKYFLWIQMYLISYQGQYNGGEKERKTMPLKLREMRTRIKIC